MTTSEDRARRARSVSEELRRYARGELLEADHADLSRAAGLVKDDDVRKMLVFAEQAWQRHKPGDGDFWSKRWSRNHLVTQASATATDAIHSGNLSQMAYIRGWVEYDSDVSGLNAVRQLENWLCMSEAAKLVYLAGHMGNGKTDFSLQALQVVNHFWQRLRETAPADWSPPAVRFAANVKVETPEDDPDVTYTPSYPALRDWADGFSSDDELWFLFDEGSTELTAQSSNARQNAMEKMAPFVKKMRKSGVNMIIVGHDGRDLAKPIRVLADFVAKSSTKTATFYRGINKREPYGELFSLSGIPPTDWNFSTDDMADWSWSSVDGGPAHSDVQQDVSERDLKRFAAIRGAQVYESVESVSKKDAAAMVSTEEISVSKQMITDAQEGKYTEVQVA